MPEGDSIYKIAVFLDERLRDRLVRGVQLHPAFGASSGPRHVSRVGSEGKHLYLTFDDGVQLRSHLGMYGSWHRYRPASPWRKPARQASIVVETERMNYVCFNAKEVQWLRLRGFERADRGNRLGPDLIRDFPEIDDILCRIAALLAPDTLIVDVLLDQRVAAGIGNVYKSELLFLESQSPLQRLRHVQPQQIAALYRRAAELLGENVGGGPRTTRANFDKLGRLWVYGRANLPCLRCGAPIQRSSLGGNPRSTYWCAGCQPEDRRG
ncbi:MAG: DNA-formamidopyrimidine glycosylase family protein [Thiohalocapsa sp.]